MARLAHLLSALVVARVASQSDVPQQVHLSYYGTTVQTNDGVTVSWATLNATATSTVQYGTTPTGLTSSATGEQVAYLPMNAGYGSVYSHHVSFVGLTPATVYYYRCGDAAAGWSAVLSFTTGPEPGSEFPFNVIVYGDMGIYNSKESMAAISALAPSAAFIYHIGDVSYADDAFLHDPLVFGYEATYNEYMRNMSDVMGGKMYHVLPGNHEAECHSPACILDDQLRTGLGNFSAYNARWRMPYAPSGSTTSMWYSFRYGSVHIVSVNTETDFPGAPLDEYASKNGGFGDQLAWLESDLAAAAADRAAGKVTWILVGGHRPMYTRGDATPAGVPKGDACPAFQAAFEPLFHEYGVDLYMCGHQHSYESIWPVYNSTNVFPSFDKPPYTTYVVTGAAGNTEGHTTYGSDPMPAWERFNNTADYGISLMTVHNDSALTFDFRRATDGAVLDSWTLTRGS